MMPITCGQVLSGAQTLGLDRLDAQLLLLHALGRSGNERAWLLAHDDDAINDAVSIAFQALCVRRAAGEPLAYLVGFKEFFGMQFAVDTSVLIPRPDTETLVAWALEIFRASGVACPAVLDLGTGSGAVAAAIANNNRCRMLAVDASADALVVARANAKQLGLPIAFAQGNWFDKVKGHFECIVSNPPYIAVDDAHLANLKYEPTNALVAGHDGLSDLRTIIDGAPAHLHSGGWLLLEHGYDQADAVRSLLVGRGFAQVQSRNDLAGIARCSGGQWADQ